MGIAAKERDVRRWTAVASTAEELLGRGRAEPAQPEELLQETVGLAHAATLACALSRGEPGEPLFESMQKEGPVKLGDAGESAGAAGLGRYESAYPVSERTVLKEEIRRLGAANVPIQRVHLLRMIASETGTVDDIDLRSGQLLAEYLVQFKSDPTEYQEVLRHAEQLGRWNAVRLGLADQLLETDGRGAQLAELFSKVMGADVDLASSAGRDKIHRRLLSEVVAGLSETPDKGVSRYRVFDQASQALLDLYIRQAKLLELPAENYASSGQPSSALAALINHFAERVEDGGLEPTELAVLRAMPYRLKALDFVAENDMQHTAALQQVWLEVLAIHLIQKYPEKAVAIRDLRDGFQAGVDKHERVFEQLRDTQANLLRMWMQLRPGFDAVMAENVETAKAD